MLPQTTIEQRSRFYTDVEGLLSPGFLTHTVVVNGVRLHLRSLGAGDLFMLKARTEGAVAHEWRVWSVATSIWMIDGRTVLGEDSVIPFLAAYVRRLPRPIVDLLFSLLLGLWVRVGDAVDATEVYCFETGSRYKWKTVGLTGLMHTGVPGADRLGLNATQRIWAAFNEMEDQKRAEETQWEGFKLVASSNAPKAIGKMDKRDQQRREEETAGRKNRLNHHFYVQVGVLDAKGEVQGVSGSAHHYGGQKSVEDLEDEMRRWVTDDQDLHDSGVAESKASITASQQAELAERESRRQMLQKKRDEMGWEAGDFKPQPLMAMTAEQLQHILTSRGPGQGGVSWIPKAPNSDRMLRTHVASADVGKLQVVDGKVTDIGANPETDERTLNELIQGRNPAFGAGE